ncbi:MAG: peptide-methionine (S)-S-oxide reductase, partial [Patescibacteria group bacterium]
IFWPAEEYHHEYYANNSDAPYCQAVIAPKCEKIKQTFPLLV